MARKFLTAIDLSKNELQNAAVQNLAAAPSAPVKGQLYFDTVGNILYWWSGAAWIAAQDAGGTGFPGYASSVFSETSFGIGAAVGSATLVARGDHTHGTPLHDNAAHSLINISALAAATAPINMGGFTITNVGTPTNPGDAANKGYVDNSIAGLSWKDSVRAATTANITQSGLAAIDGVVPIAGDRILCKDQSSAAFNGIWVAAAGAWARATDADVSTELPAASVYVEEGTVNADTAWTCTANNPIVLGTTSLPWVQFAGGGAVTAGAGLTQSGNTLNVIGDASITVTADQISRATLSGDVTAPAGANTLTIGNDVVTNAKLANMPTMTVKGNNTGATADPVDLTGSQLAAIIGNNYMRHISQLCLAATSTPVNHGYNTNDVMVQVYRTATPFDTVEADVERTTVNQVTVRFAVAPAANEYTILVSG